MVEMFGEVPDIAFYRLAEELNSSRTFWYDCAPDEKNEKNPEAVWAQRQLERAKWVNGFHLRLGTLSRSGNKNKVNQKEVDVLLAVELLSNSYMKNMQQALIITGDLDFRPALEEISRHGMIIHLYYDQTAISELLSGVADVRQSLSVDDYVRWSEPFANMPNGLAMVGPSSGLRVGATEIASGIVNGASIEVAEKSGDDTTWLVWSANNKTNRHIYSFRRKDHRYVLHFLLPRLFGGSIEWLEINVEECRSYFSPSFK